MKTKRRVAGLFLAFAMLATLFGTAFTASAAELWEAKTPAAVKKGDTEKIQVLGKGAVQWVRAEPEGVVRVVGRTQNEVEVEGLNVGKTVLTVQSLGKNDNGEIIEYKGTINITVTDETGIVSDGLGIASTGQAANFRVEVGKSIVGPVHKTISVGPTVAPAGIVTATKKGVTAATADAATLKALGVTSSSYYQVEYTGVTPGRATVTYTYTDEGDSTVKNGSVTVEVLAAGTLAEQVNNASTEVSLALGSKSTLDKDYRLIKDVLSSSPTVVKATLTGETGKMNIDINALKEGSSTLSFKYQETEGGALKEETIRFIVRSSTDTTTTSSDVASGIFMTPRKSSVPAANIGKSYFNVLRVNDVKIETSDTASRSKLLWISTAPSVASINAATGEFEIKGKGTTKIVCISKDGTMMDTVSVTVK